MQLTIDARMLYHSGIGTTLRNILLRFPELSTRDMFYAGNEKACTFLAALFKNPRILLNAAPIYSIAEQIYAAQHSAGNALFWSPHYNIPLAHRGPLVVTIHDTLHLAHPELVGGWHKRLYARYMISRAAKRADAIICVSEFTRQELYQRVAVDLKKVVVIHNGVDEEWFSIPPDASPHERPYLLFVGNVKPHKNLIRLLRAFALISKKIPHDLVIVGQKEGMRSADENVHRLADELGSRIYFTGFVEDVALKQFFAHASLFVFPSYYEGFGLPPLEAMAAGVPTVVARAGSLPEVCGECVTYFDPFNEEEMAAAIEEALALSGADRDKRISIARQHARSFSWETTAAKMWQVLEKTRAGSLK